MTTKGKWWLEFMTYRCESSTFQSSLLGQGLSTEGLQSRPFIPQIPRPFCLSGFRSGKGSVTTSQWFNFPLWNQSSEPNYTESFLEEALAGKRSKTGLGCLPLFLSVTVFWLQPTLSLLTLSRRSCCWYSNLFCTALLEMQVLEWMFIMP